MAEETEMLWLRFRFHRTSSSTLQLLKGCSLSGVEEVAHNKRTLLMEKGETFSTEAILEFSKQLAKATEELQEDVYSEDLPYNVEKAAIELTCVLYAHTIEFTYLEPAQMRGATLECLYEQKHGTVTFHASAPGNILDPKLLCPSAYMDNFLDLQRGLQYRTMNALQYDLLIVDDVVNFLEELGKSLSDLIDTNVGILTLSISQDFAPACSLVLGGRLDAAYAIVRRNIEILGTARIISDDQEARHIWLDAHRDNNSWRAFRTHFTTKRLFPRGNIVWDEIFAMYDELSRKHHANPRSFDRIRELGRTDSKITIGIAPTSFISEEFEYNAAAFWDIVYKYLVISTGLLEIIMARFDRERPDWLNKAIVRCGEMMLKSSNGRRAWLDQDKNELPSVARGEKA